MHPLLLLHWLAYIPVPYEKPNQKSHSYLPPPSVVKGLALHSQGNRCIAFHRWMCEWGTVWRPGSGLWTLSQVWPAVSTGALDRDHHAWAMCVFGVCATVRLPHRGSTSITLQATGEALREISLCGSCPLLCLIKSGRNPICVSLFKGCGSEASPFIYWVAAQDWWSVSSEVTACPFNVSQGSLRTTGVPLYWVSTNTLCPCSHLLHCSENMKGSEVERTFHVRWTSV